MRNSQSRATLRCTVSKGIRPHQRQRDPASGSGTARWGGQVEPGHRTRHTHSHLARPSRGLADRRPVHALAQPQIKATLKQNESLGRKRGVGVELRGGERQSWESEKFGRRTRDGAAPGKREEPPPPSPPAIPSSSPCCCLSSLSSSFLHLQSLILNSTMDSCVRLARQWYR